MSTNANSLKFAQFWLKQFPELAHASVLPVKEYPGQDVVILRRQFERGGHAQVRLFLDYNVYKMHGHCAIYDHRGTCTFVGAVFKVKSMKDLARKLYERSIINSKEFKNV